MTLHDALDALAHFEETLSSFYIWLAAQVKEDAEAAQLFILLAEQEQGHGELLRETDRRLGEEGSLELSLDVGSAVSESLQMIETYRAAVDRPSAQEALTFALGLEDGAAEQLGRGALRDLVPEIGPTFAILDREDERHAELMRELLSR